MSIPIPLPADFEERVYAGVLGKIIGVSLGYWSGVRTQYRVILPLVLRSIRR